MLSKLPRTIQIAKDDSGIVCVLLDQRKLPHEVTYIDTSDWREVVDAIKTLAVRGAPAIGAAGAAGVVLAAQEYKQDKESFFAACKEITNARPTAVNLAWAVNRMMAAIETGAKVDIEVLYNEAQLIIQEDEATNRVMGKHGAKLLFENATVLTHCNAGSLATSFYGTALGVIYAAAEQGKIKRVYADETRPVGQGARLTAWELAQANIPVTLICDNMAASVIANGEIDAVIVGADRITANGDVANKIGTYGVAILAAHHNVPFYVVAPSSTIDMSLSSGAEIPIEQRAAEEVLPAPIKGVEVFNPAFDVTPAHLITKIITERGVFSPEELKDAYNN